ncbi:hypothetical protein CVT24_010433 [Panaeolus cyanescens]|uniref:MutS protein homolog 3 n=1 Tax=Panaeolus cyanescens TaxID=181874 RepID=A0A409YPP6_9AGAR|nr:hypothetical protein CVT24_010433 [Panaeolus cyanescens]
MKKASGSTQPNISSFFLSSSPKKQTSNRLKRPSDSTTIDLTGSDDEFQAHARKRTRTSTPEGGGPNSSRVPVATANTVVESWRFSPEKAGQSAPVQRSAKEKARHEAFKAKLLQDNNRFLRKAAAEDVEEMNVDESVEPDSQEPAQGAVDAYEQLHAMFSSKAKGKGKAPQKPTKKPAEVIGPAGVAYTPLEHQIVALKKDNRGTVLMVEVGYKYKFFGDDAKARFCNLMNFLVASIPIHRRDVHLKKLLARGYRVGIVNQIETAALKKIGDNRNAPFERKVTQLYTAATYVDELGSVDDVEARISSPILCLVEEERSNHEVSIGMISICPSTGDVVWDDFNDNIMRLELETRLVHTSPSELLVPKTGISEPTGKMLSHFTGVTPSGQRTRSELFKDVMEYSDAFDYVSKFYTDKNKFGVASESFRSGRLLAAITDFPKRVVVALAHTIKHLRSFDIADAFLETQFFTRFATRAHMLLAANTLINLEVYRNETDHTTKGSLLSILDHTKTKFGSRLLRNWVGRPLVDKKLLEERIDAVQEILECEHDVLFNLRELLRGLPDLAKGLSRIQYGQCTPHELSVLIPAFNKVARTYDGVDLSGGTGLKSPLLNSIVVALPRLKEPMKELMETVDLKKAAEGNKHEMWRNISDYPEVDGAELAIRAIEIELQDELKAARKTLRMPSLQWTTVANDDYLVEVKKSENRPIPDNWIMHSKTKFLARYQPPSVRKKLEEKAQRQEMLDKAVNEAYQGFLRDISQKYYGVMRDAVNKLAIADCLLSFAQLALQDNYVRPEFTDEDVLEIVDGTHPVLTEISSNPYTPNSITIGGKEARNKIITGPNMGGKSSCVRMIALIALMAQIGSYVPATSVRMSLLDSILTRMGASDDLARGRSTFMVEMSETSEILQAATHKSLVILDELGRGTSTFDGMAIADATLQHLVSKVKCKTLFITHYPIVASKLEKKYPLQVQNLHMGYRSSEHIDRTRSIVFLYRLTKGLATGLFD